MFIVIVVPFAYLTKYFPPAYSVQLCLMLKATVWQNRFWHWMIQFHCSFWFSFYSFNDHGLLIIAFFLINFCLSFVYQLWIRVWYSPGSWSNFGSYGCSPICHHHSHCNSQTRSHLPKCQEWISQPPKCKGFVIWKFGMWVHFGNCGTSERSEPCRLREFCEREKCTSWN